MKFDINIFSTVAVLLTCIGKYNNIISNSLYTRKICLLQFRKNFSYIFSLSPEKIATKFIKKFLRSVKNPMDTALFYSFEKSHKSRKQNGRH